jgi:hypothetical protein
MWRDDGRARPGGIGGVSKADCQQQVSLSLRNMWNVFIIPYFFL